MNELKKKIRVTDVVSIIDEYLTTYCALVYGHMDVINTSFLEIMNELNINETNGWEFIKVPEILLTYNLVDTPHFKTTELNKWVEKMQENKKQNVNAIIYVSNFYAGNRLSNQSYIKALLAPIARNIPILCVFTDIEYSQEQIDIVVERNKTEIEKYFKFDKYLRVCDTPLNNLIPIMTSYFTEKRNSTRQQLLQCLHSGRIARKNTSMNVSSITRGIKSYSILDNLYKWVFK